jgi:hypothetical protein
VGFLEGGAQYLDRTQRTAVSPDLERFRGEDRSRRQASKDGQNEKTHNSIPFFDKQHLASPSVGSYILVSIVVAQAVNAGRPVMANRQFVAIFDSSRSKPAYFALVFATFEAL